MIRKAMIALAAGAVLASAVTAFADPVDDAKRTVEQATGVRVPTLDGGTVIGGGGKGTGRSAVVGYITIQSQGTGTPTFNVVGALAEPTLWTCAGSGDASAYRVSCLPASTEVELKWHCDVLHADITTGSAEARAHTALDCDSDGVAESETATVTGMAGHDSKFAVDTRIVSAFTCTIDGGGDAAVANWTGGCGDPGLVGVE